MSTEEKIPIDLVHMLPELDSKLLELLNTLTPDEWQKPTVARLWVVKDVVAHLLDGNLRTLSILRDDYQGEKTVINSYQDLLDFLNTLNADWVKAMKRLSPQMLITLHEITGPMYCNYYASLDPFDKAGFPVNWAGETESRNWMHIAREYTEKFLHQQQIRDAVNKPGIMTKEYFYPFLDVFMRALPYTYRNTEAPEDTVIAVTVPGEAGGSWYIQRKQARWVHSANCSLPSAAELIIHQGDAWKLFSKSIRPEDIRGNVEIKGDQELGSVALTMISVMA